MNRGPVTQHDIARHAGVSRALVSMALSGSPKVAPETRSRILEVAHELGYVKNLSATSLVNQVTPILGIVLPNISNPYFENLFSEIQRIAAENGLLPLIATGGNDVVQEELITQRFLELRVAGIIMVSSAMEDRPLHQLGEKIPVLSVGQPDIGGHVDSIGLDETRAAELLAAHFSERGWRRVGYVYTDQVRADRGLVHRQRALAHACETNELTFLAAPVKSGMKSTLESFLAAGDEPTVVIGHNDVIATQIVSELRREELTVGTDVGVAGYDNTYLSTGENGDFTSISQSITQQAAMAIEFIESRSRERDLPARRFITEPDLVIRSSTLRTP